MAIFKFVTKQIGNQTGSDRSKNPSYDLLGNEKINN